MLRAILKAVGGEKWLVVIIDDYDGLEAIWTEALTKEEAHEEAYQYNVKTMLIQFEEFKSSPLRRK